MGIEPIYMQFFIAVVGVGVQFYIAERSRRQTAKQTEDTLDVQRLVSCRSVASFIADKRQKWIDELRIDMAFHLAQSREILWKWDAIRSQTTEKIEKKSNNDPIITEEIKQTLTDAFSPINGELDREHEERHIRIKFRLNPQEELHIKLRECLDKIRDTTRQMQGAKGKDENWKLIDSMKELVNHASELTENVLKTEWDRVKQEVAYPELLMAKIPKPE